MGQLDNPDENTLKRYEDLCVNLNMDRDSADEAWRSYETIRQNYTLEGDQIHWLGCALYVACRRSSFPIIGPPGIVVQGNCVSLTRLLRLCKFSLIQFFNKSKKWADMANIPAEFRSKIDRLERNFVVSMVIFKKFQPIFIDMFRNPADDQPRQSKSRKQRNIPCSPSKVFDFCWTLFVCVKGEFPDISDDLVNSYHLLLACCDMIFSNAVMALKRDILNPQFPGLPNNFFDENFVLPSEPPCVIDQLCQTHDGIPLEAKSIKEYTWKSHIRTLIGKKSLKGDPDTLCGLLEPGNFENNCKAINKAYETFVLNVGDFDERIFLGDDANADIGTPTKICSSGEFAEKLQAKKNLNQQYGGMKQLAPATPLTGREFLRGKDAQQDVTPMSTATQNVSRLHAMLAGRQAAPSELLVSVFRGCARDPHDKIREQVKEMGQQFYTRYTQQSDRNCPSHIDFPHKRLQLGESLYYKLLENILVDERKKKPPNFDFSGLLEQEIFHQTLFACSLEIVIYSYNSHWTFPWILEVLNLEPYHFYKVIEVIVRVEDQLSRDMVKHLNLIEEQILESLAWRGNSPLWENIKASGQLVPSCEEVCLPAQLDDSSANLKQAVRRLVLDATQGGAPQLPVTSASDRFQSPVPSGQAKKNLFGDSALRPKIKPAIEGENGQRYIPVSYVPNAGSVIIQAQPAGAVRPEATAQETKPDQTALPAKQDGVPEKKPKRAGSLGLFFRKFYHLASVRMQDLCMRLEISDRELKKKIWTCFEHTVVEHTDLMENRHLDQILMCAVYVICKVSQVEKTFTDIMRCYRLQPQAASHVYRSVLLYPNKRLESGVSSDSSPSTVENDASRDDRVSSSGTLPVSQPPSAPPTPTHLAGTASSFEFGHRGDLIKFYNTVFVQKLQTFAVRLSTRGVQPVNVTLSPIPLGKNQPVSPCRRVSDKHPVFIRSLEQKMLPSSPTQPLSYCFSRSPAKDLHAINNMIQISSNKVGKRLLIDDSLEGENVPAKLSKTVSKKLQDLIDDRLGQS
ncbi:retinoblastoma-like protein 1 isoform X1 [Bacillus rossius redtenbacheri]|uniref:retinoblastoma-like protein 1 isoform X1 n=1 Tax=Bacillus rossius redtenbacheri TaxID=93214 RepID=UPI002FDED87D